DDELLAALALELQPVLGPPAAVPRVGALGDEPLPALGARLPVVRLPLGVPVLGVAQRVVEGQQGAQDRLALQQRQRADVPPAGPQHVKQVVVGRHLGEQVRGGIDDAKAVLQKTEFRLALVEGDDLPVDDEVVAEMLRGQRFGDLREGAADVVLVAGHQPYLPAADERQAALAVQLALEDPGRVGEPVPGERGQLRIQPAGQARLALLVAHLTPLPLPHGQPRHEVAPTQRRVLPHIMHVLRWLGSDRGDGPEATQRPARPWLRGHWARAEQIRRSEMSLPACQERMLSAIEKTLRAGEPRLASIFAIFTRLASGEELPRTEQLMPQPWLRRVLASAGRAFRSFFPRSRPRGIA